MLERTYTVGAMLLCSCGRRPGLPWSEFGTVLLRQLDLMARRPMCFLQRAASSEALKGGAHKRKLPPITQATGTRLTRPQRVGMYEM